MYGNDTAHSGACVAVYPDSSSLTVWAAYGRCAPDVSPLKDTEAHLNNSEAIWDYGFCPTSHSWVPILAMVLYLSCFSVGE